MSQEHIMQAYDEELSSLNQLILNMGEMVEGQTNRLFKALQTQDEASIDAIITDDIKLDRMEESVNAMVMQIIAKRQPMATDLRLIVGSLKISGDLERMGDYVRNIAKRSKFLKTTNHLLSANGTTVRRMADLVADTTQRTMQSYQNWDAELAHEIWVNDENIDLMLIGFFRELLTYMMENPSTISECTQLLFIAKNVERMGDLLTNVAEQIHHIAKGEPIEGKRPKGDVTKVMRPS